MKRSDSDFTPGLQEHNHPEDPANVAAAKVIRQQVKNEATKDLFTPAGA